MGTEEVGRKAAIDPGAHRLATAICSADGALLAVGYDLPLDGVVEAVLEKPRDYKRFAVAHRDLDRLRERLAALKRAWPRVKFREVFPAAWKGNVPKDIHHRRLHETLTPDERKILAGPDDDGYDHNLNDAVALLKTTFGRFQRGGR